MNKRTLPRHAAASTWSHPYGRGPFDPYLYADGGDGDSGESSGGETDAGQAAEDADSGDSGQADGGQEEKPKPKPPPADKGGKSGDDGEDDPAATIARLQKELKATNAEAAKARTNAKKTAADEARGEIVQELGKALGLIKDDTQSPPDPAELTRQITAAQSAHRETAVELAVYRGASKHGADPDALTDSRAFLRSIQDLDPTDEGFNKAVGDAIKKAVADNPKLKTAGQAPARTSGDFSGGTGKPSTDSIEAHREARRKQRSS